MLALASFVLLALYGLVWSPADRELADTVRIMYVHVPAAIVMFVASTLTSVASGMWLRRRSAGWDALAVSCAEIGLVFAVLCLLTGSLWGRPTWGTYWTWDARLTSTAMLAVLLVGYLSLRQLDWGAGGRSRRTAVVGLLLLPNVIIVHYSVDWWRSLHQGATITTLNPTIEGEMLTALVVGLVAFGLAFAWLLLHRFRVAWLAQAVERRAFEDAVAQRRAEGAGARAGAAAASGEVGVR